MRFVAMDAGWTQTCGLDDYGSVHCWGMDYSGEGLPPPGDFVSISAGGQHACAIASDGRLECWGSDVFGQVSAAP